MEEESLHIRGIILAGTIDVERLIDEYLAHYFCSTFEKTNELMELIFYTDKIGLDAKREVFTHIIKKHNSNFIKTYPTFLKQLENLIPHRNVFAHGELDLTKTEAMTFKRYKGGKAVFKEYTQKDLLQLQKDILKISSRLISLLLLMPPRQ